MYTLSDIAVKSLVEKAVKYGVDSRGQKDVTALQIARFWLDGYMACSFNITEDDRKSLLDTIDNYYFLD